MENKLKRNLIIINQIIDLKKDPNSRNSNFLRTISKGMEFFIKNLDELKVAYKKEH
jgi:hypothetical protein